MDLVLGLGMEAAGLGLEAVGFASGFAGSLLNGGSIGDAFKSGLTGDLTTVGAGIAKWGGGVVNDAVSGAKDVITGGTSSEIGEGKFANGAEYEAFKRADNDSTSAVDAFVGDPSGVIPRGSRWSYQNMRSLILKNGSTAGQAFVNKLEGSGVYIYGFTSVRVLETLKGDFHWKDTGTSQHWVWTSDSLKGFEPELMKQLPYLSSAQPGVFINNSLTDMQAVETTFHEFYHYANPSASEIDTRTATTQFLIDIGTRQSQIPGAITASGQVNSAAINASDPQYIMSISRSGSLSDNMIGLNGILPGHP
jgi:hypothetical protein